MTAEQKLERAAAKAAAAREGLEAAVREARKSGMALREIAKHAGMSHEQVRRLTT